MVEEAIERLQKDDPVDLRWTRSVDSGDFLTFTGSEEERTCASSLDETRKSEERNRGTMGLD